MQAVETFVHEEAICCRSRFVTRRLVSRRTLLRAQALRVTSKVALIRFTALTVGGVFLVALPLVFAVFAPELLGAPQDAVGGLTLSTRIYICIPWIIVAILIGGIGVAKDVREREERHHEIDRQETVIDQSTALEALDQLLAPGTVGTPPSFSWTVYVLDDGANRLAPVFPQAVLDMNDPRVFSPGSGAVGAAYVNRAVVVVTGDAVSNADYGLTTSQQLYFAQARSVVAAPISLNSDVVGVLSGISREDDPFFADPTNVDRLMKLAHTVGVLLVYELLAP